MNRTALKRILADEGLLREARVDGGPWEPGLWQRHPRGPEKQTYNTKAIVMEEAGGWVVYLYEGRKWGKPRVLDRKGIQTLGLGVHGYSFDPFSTESKAMAAADKYLSRLPKPVLGSRRKKSPTAAERAMISAWKWGHITREELERRIGKARADEIAPRNR